jgi:ribosomal protein L16 Arg81 hydroxylase
VQWLGRKRWRVYPPTFPLPIGLQVSDGRDGECAAEPVIDCVLTPGDLLYIPRGWWHEAIPFDEASLHLSVGTYGPTVHDYLMWVWARHSIRIEAARRSLTDAVDEADLERVLQRIAGLALDPACRAEFGREIAQRERLASEFNTELFFSTGPDGFDPGDIVSLNSCHAIDTTRSSLSVNGAELQMNPLSLSILAALKSAGWLSIEALCAALAHERPELIRLAVLDLAQHEIVSIAQSREL